MIKLNRIRGRMAEKGMRVCDLAKHLSLNPASLYRRFNDPDSFTISEVVKIKEVLGFSDADAADIFFDPQSHLVRRKRRRDLQ